MPNPPNNYRHKRSLGLCGQNNCQTPTAMSRCDKHRMQNARGQTPNPIKRSKFNIPDECIEALLGYLKRTEPYLSHDWTTASRFISQHPEVFFTKASPVLDWAIHIDSGELEDGWDSPLVTKPTIEQWQHFNGVE